ncbi:centrosomal protein of 55 kDa isoform X2 [Erythrolamprus reginae]|uniref:centrosomal protein of 55 kDa isoform X2 n=1 Tax=Erythrolamprus reginae TaxID=121349 RepID=UPI00396CC6D9
MTSKKWGFKCGDSKSETELQTYKKENAALKKSLEEIIKEKRKMTPEERKRLLEKILALQTETEEYKNKLGKKDQEIQVLKDELRSRSKSTDVASLRGQLEEKTKEVAKREQLLNSLSEEVEWQKNNISAVSARCTELERASDVQITQEKAVHCAGTPVNIHEVEIQLKDALEKNHQWIIYDQQREAYVQSLLARIFELEEQLKNVIQEQAKGTKAEGDKQRYYEQMLATAERNLEAERRIVSQLHAELNELQKKCDGIKQEAMNAEGLIRLQKQTDIKALQDENHLLQRVTHEYEATRKKLDEERKRAQTLSIQVEVLHRSLIKQQEQQTRIATLEQQIQSCTSDFENEKLDRQNLQIQLNKVLKELRKANDQITRLEPSFFFQKLPERGECLQVVDNFQAVFEDKLMIQDKHSSPKHTSLLDESFLECPKCKAHYPTSHHRELLTHIDLCTV